MESSKQKRAAADDSRYGGDQRKLRRGSGGERGRVEGVRDQDRHDAEEVVVNDAEVEEFYAILQRVRAASLCIAVGEAARRTEAEQFQWQPAFVREDFEGGAGAAVKDGGGEEKEVSGEDKGEEEVRARLELDLNEDPVPERGELTAHSAGVLA